MNLLKQGGRAIADLFRKTIAFFAEVKRFWRTPKEGEHVPYKEIVNYALGSIGPAFINAIGISFGVGCFLIGAIYKLSFKDLYIIGLINMPFSFIYSPMNMIVTDNLGNIPKKTMKRMRMYLLPSAALGAALMCLPNSFMENIIPAFGKILGWIFVYNTINIYYNIFVYKKLSPRFGKFRVWALVGALPCLVMMLLITWLPFLDMEYANRLWLLNCLFGLYNSNKIFTDQRGNVNNVMSPNSNERVKINSLVTMMLAPVHGIRNVIVPMLAMYTGGLTNLNTYRIIVPITYAVGIPLTLFMALGVKDRVILEKKHVTNVNMFNGFREVLKNKYMWIIYLSDNLSAFSWGAISLMSVVIIYAMRQDWLMGIAETIVGFCGFPGLFLAQKMVKKMGKRNTLLFEKFFYFTYFIFAFLSIRLNNSYWLFLGLIFSNFFTVSGGIAKSGITPDIWDYQQYISGKRLESSMGIINTLGNPLVQLMSMCIPLVYAAIGFTNDWNILYVPELRNRIFTVTLLLCLGGHIVSIIPLFFYDLNEKKHAMIIEELQKRVALLDAQDEAREQQEKEPIPAQSHS